MQEEILKKDTYTYMKASKLAPDIPDWHSLPENVKQRMGRQVGLNPDISGIHATTAGLAQVPCRCKASKEADRGHKLFQ